MAARASFVRKSAPVAGDDPQQAAAILGPTRHSLMNQGVNVLDANGAPRLVRDLLPAGKVAAE